MQDPLLIGSQGALIQRLEAQFICRGDPPLVLDQALAVLEASPLLSPTHCGIAEGVRDAYDRLALVAAYRARLDAAPCFIRTRRPGRYAGLCYADDAATLVSVDVSSRDELEQGAAYDFFGSLSDFAGQLPTLDFGSVDIVFAAAEPETRMSSEGTGHHLTAYASEGPSVLFARNFFGSRLVQLAGGEGPFAESGLEVRRLPCGTIQLDLLPSVWQHPPQALKHGQTQALFWLERIGLRAVEQEEAVTPGARWVPPAPSG